MLAALSPEAQINRILDEVGCVPSNFSDIANKHANSRVIAALKGNNDFSAEDGQYYLRVAREMKRLANEVKCPVDWRRTQEIKKILAERQQPTSRPTPFEVVVIGDKYFERVTESGEIETTTDLQKCAAFKDWHVARAAGKLLDALGQFGVRVVPITNERRHDDSFANSLMDVGFVQETRDELSQGQIGRRELGNLSN